MKDVQTFKRGQVWFIDDRKPNVGSIQGKSRPYLVVSNDKCNAFSNVIHVAPITTQEKTQLPTHVTIFDPYRRDTQVILVEQITTKDVSNILPIAKYKYTLTEEKMAEVDKAMIIQFGLQNYGLTIDKFEELLDSLKDQKLAELKSEAERIDSARASSYAEKLVETVNNIKISSNEDKVIESSDESSDKKSIRSFIFKDQAPKSQIDKFNQRLQKSAQLNNNVPQNSNTNNNNNSTSNDESNKSRNRWTDERKKEFLADVDNPANSQELIMNKYNLYGKSYFNTISKFRRELGIPNPKRNKKSESSLEAEKFLADYDSKPLSEVMTNYNLPTKKSVVELASKYRSQLSR